MTPTGADRSRAKVMVFAGDMRMSGMLLLERGALYQPEETHTQSPLRDTSATAGCMRGVAKGVGLLSVLPCVDGPSGRLSCRLQFMKRSLCSCSLEFALMQRDVRRKFDSPGAAAQVGCLEMHLSSTRRAGSQQPPCSTVAVYALGEQLRTTELPWRVETLP
jgi:hypothetical protein